MSGKKTKKYFLSYYSKCISHLTSGDVDSAKDCLNDARDDIKKSYSDLKGMSANVFVGADTLNTLYSYADTLKLNRKDLNNADLLKKSRDSLINNCNAMMSWLVSLRKLYRNIDYFLNRLDVRWKHDCFIVYNKIVIDSVDDFVKALPKTLDANQIDNIKNNLLCYDLIVKVIP